MLARPHLDVLLVTADADAALAFWTERIGLAVADDRPLDGARFVRLDCGPQRLTLVEPAAPPPRHPGGLYAGTGYRVLGLVVDGLDALCRRLEAAGRRVAEAVGVPGRAPVRFARDADGNLLELIGGSPGPADGRADRLQVGLTVDDPEAVRRFWCGGLGLPAQAPAPIGPDMTRHAVSVGHSTLKYWQRPEPLPCLAGAPGAARGIRAVTIDVADPEAAVAALVAHGGRRVADPGLPSADVAAWVADAGDRWVGLRAA